MEFSHSEDTHFSLLLFSSKKKKLMVDKTQNIFHIIAEPSGFKKYPLNRLD